MYALIVPASTPLVLLAVLMALSWWEDRILPSPPVDPAALTAPAETPAEAPTETTVEATVEAPATPVPATQHLELAHAHAALTGEVPLLPHSHPRSGREQTRGDSFDHPRG